MIKMFFYWEPKIKMGWHRGVWSNPWTEQLFHLRRIWSTRLGGMVKFDERFCFLAPDVLMVKQQYTRIPKAVNQFNLALHIRDKQCKAKLFISASCIQLDTTRTIFPSISLRESKAWCPQYNRLKLHTPALLVHQFLSDYVRCSYH